MGVLDRLQALDAYPKVRSEFRVWTEQGGLVSLVALSLMLVLILSESWSLLRNEASEEVVVDHALHDTLTIHMDVTFPKVKCPDLAMAAVDAAGSVQTMVKHAVFKLSLDEDGFALGHTVRQDEDASTLLSQSEARKMQEEMQAEGSGEDVMLHKPQHTSCGSCYGVSGVKEPFKCCNTCKEVEEAFAFRHWDWRIEGKDRFWQCREEHSWRRGTDEEHEMLEHKPEVGCEVFGSLYVAKSKGSFHFGASTTMSGRNLMLMMMGGLKTQFDMSHTIHSIWFGEERPERSFAALKLIDSSAKRVSPPLSKVSHSFPSPMIVQYHVKVVATDVSFLNGTKVESFAYSASEHTRPVSPGSLPSLHFMYDTPPLRLVYLETKKSVAHFFTNLCALIGGVFTVFGMFDTIIYKKKFSVLTKKLSQSSKSLSTS